MEYFRMLISIRARRSRSDQREMQWRLATQLFDIATIVSKGKGLSSDLKTGDLRERVLKRKRNSRYAGFIFSVVTAPQGKVFSEVTGKDA